ncbi:Alpha/Beta hydrolase protein [Dichotomocladium elegans]|nr:Alpha/Beta hydrolase protein [Dichotomocladium elegans]
MEATSNQTSPLSALSALPAVIPPTTHLNFLRNWWQRSDHTAAIAETRLLHYALQPTEMFQQPVIGRLFRVPLGTDGHSSPDRNTPTINTLYLRQNRRNAPFAPSEELFELHPENSLDTLHNDLKASDSDTKSLVMCHGYGAGLGFFYRNYYALGQMPGWRVFALDWIGMGRSSRPKWTITRKNKGSWDQIIDEVEDHFVESLESWRKAVGLETMTLMGHSLGGYFAACYALKYPKRVEKLILVSPAGIPESPSEVTRPKNETPEQVIDKQASNINNSMQAEAASAALGDTSDVPVPRRRIPLWAKYLWDKNITPMSIVRMSGPLGASLVNVYTSRRFAHLETQEQHALYDYLYHITSSAGSGEFALAAILAPGAYARRPLFRRLAGLQMPTVFIYGEDDWMDYKAAEKAKEHMKVPVKVIRIPYGGHHMYLDNPDEFNDVVYNELTQ